MDRRLLVLALGMFALGTDSFVVAGVLPQISQAFQVSIEAAAGVQRLVLQHDATGAGRQ